MNSRTAIFPLTGTKAQTSKFTGTGKLNESGIDRTAFVRSIGQFPAKTS